MSSRAADVFAAWFEQNTGTTTTGLCQAFSQALEGIAAERAAQGVEDDQAADPDPTTHHEMTDEELYAAIAADARRSN